MKNLQNCLNKATGTALGLGYIPIAPGTMGSIGGALVILFLNSISLSIDYILITLITIFFFAGTYAAYKLEHEWGEDPSRIVIDEVVGMWISMLFIPFSYLNLGIAFILFRFFDIVKPLFIRKAEKVKYGFGVMLDDVWAGVYTNILLQIFVYLNLNNI